MEKYEIKLHFFSLKASMKCSIISLKKCDSNYLKLVNSFGKSVSEQLLKWLPISLFFLLQHSYIKTWIKLETT